MQPKIILESHQVHHRLSGLLVGRKYLVMHTGRFQAIPEAFRLHFVLAVNRQPELQPIFTASIQPNSVRIESIFICLTICKGPSKILVRQNEVSIDGKRTIGRLHPSEH